MDNTAPDRQWVTCPGCSEAFDPEAEAQSRSDDGSVQCPFCSTRFKLDAFGAVIADPAPASPAPDEFMVIEDDVPPPAPVDYAAPHGDTFNQNKVRQLSALRRGAYRTRSYFTMGAFLLGVAAVQLAILAYRHVRLEGWYFKPIAYVVVALAAATGAALCVRHIIALTRELSRPVLDDPETPPDFSTLSDGSDYWKKLEQL